MSKIKSIQAIQVLDSRGYPTVACKVATEAHSAISMVPSGASTGSKEALELRDNNNEYCGKGVAKAVDNINSKIKNAIIGMDCSQQFKIDDILIELDGTTTKSELGANSILAVSIAVMKLAAKTKHIELFQYVNDLFNINFSSEIQMSLPVPMLNIINGGEHANNNIDIQEFMIIPNGAESFSESIRWSVEIYQALKTNLKVLSYPTTVGDEGGFAPNLNSNQEALDHIMRAIEDVTLKPGVDVSIALDCAASEFYSDGMYKLKAEKKSYSSTEFTSYLTSLVKSYPILSIEDGMDENDLKGWKFLTKELGQKCQLVGDDLFVTNVNELKEGIENNVANSILIKFNQVGTIKETFETFLLAKNNNIKTIISHRSGETEDTTISDISVGLCAEQIKTGAPARSDRTSKYNRLLFIESENQSLDYANKIFN
ncbi:phosphopyruvate hydratase [SAR86 cluster bacterium]|nr:phosphopyruvate hydratase [SAR86 cluster bacterium]